MTAAAGCTCRPGGFHSVGPPPQGLAPAVRDGACPIHGDAAGLKALGAVARAKRKAQGDHKLAELQVTLTDDKGSASARVHDLFAPDGWEPATWALHQVLERRHGKVPSDPPGTLLRLRVERETEAGPRPWVEGKHPTPDTRAAWTLRQAMELTYKAAEVADQVAVRRILDQEAGEPGPQPHQAQAVILARRALAQASAYLELASMVDPEALG